MVNPYNTKDPQKLFELKKMEVEAMLDVLKSINVGGRTIEEMCLITRNVLRAQLGVRQLIFYYADGNEWREGMRHGFSALSVEMMDELLAYQKKTPVTSGFAPHLNELGAEYIVPIPQNEQPGAYFVIADFADSNFERENDLLFIETLGSILYVAIRNQQLTEQRLQQENLKRELEVAGKIQQQLLTSDFTRFEEIDVFGMNVSHYSIGGDFFDIIKRGSGTTFLCIADVAGKGIGAALLMSNIQARLRALCAQYIDPATIIRELNQHVFEITQGDRFVTLFLARVDRAEGRIVYVNAGHNYPLFQANGRLEELQTGSLLLGIMPDIPVEQAELYVAPEDRLFMFTDGLVEEVNEAGEMFGNERLRKTLEELPPQSARKVVQYVRELLQAFNGEAERTDDLTMLCVRFLP